MTETVTRVAKSTQEQAVASWVTHLNQMRLDTLIDRLDRQDINLEEALSELAELKAFIGDPTHILGRESTKHGEIAEHMQVNISNARRAIQGLSKEYTFEGVGRTAPEDYLKNGQQIQSKFYNGLKQTLFNHHGLEEHLETYPEFVKNGGAYDIPKDQYEDLVNLLDKYHSNPHALERADGSSYSFAKRIDEFIKKNNLEVGKDIKPAVSRYDEVQLGVVNDTVDREKTSVIEEDERRRWDAYKASEPTIREGVKTAGASAVIEGGVAFCISVSKKRKVKRFSDFTSDDWKEIGADTGKGFIEGGIRGGVIYTLTNFTATPANIASAYVTAAFGVAQQLRLLDAGQISEEDFLINCETVCLDVSISAIASLAGQLVIPVPVLGAVIGNVAGEFIYELCKKEGSRKSQQIVIGYHQEMEQLNQQLDIQLLNVILEVQNSLKKFDDLEKLAFDVNINIAFNGSVKLAEEVGVSKEKILRTKSQIDDFFLV